MMTDAVKAEILRLAVEVDLARCQIASERFMAAVMTGSIDAPFPMETPAERLKDREIVDAGVQRIAALLELHLSADDIRLLAARYVIRATSLERLVNARNEALVKTEEADSRRSWNLESEREKTRELRQKNALLPSIVRSAQARRGAQAKDKNLSEARQFIRNEWQLHRDTYKNNKTEFAGEYVKRLTHEFKDSKGDPLKVTVRTIRESWLVDTLPASKQAGEPADG